MIEVIQWFNGPIPKIYRQCMDKIKEAAFQAGFKYELFDKKIYAHNQDVRKVSDEYRHFLMIENPQRWWIDSDMLPIGDLSEIKFEPGKPYCHDSKSPESAIYANGCIEQIERWYEAIEKGISIQKMLEINRSTYNTIPPGYLLHLHLGCMVKFKMMKNDHCTLTKSENGELNFESIELYNIEKLRG
jgi:hypothetical protein